MQVLLFMPQFRRRILTLDKVLTFRAYRRDCRAPVVLHEPASLRCWSGEPYRSKQLEFAQAVPNFLSPARIEREEVFIMAGGERYLSPHQLNAIAWKDGFDFWHEMVAFHEANHPLPWEGNVIGWSNLVPTKP